MSAYDIAVDVIRKEHQALALVMEALQRVLVDIGKQHAQPDFAFFAAALYYIDDFPERCHHPKEDEYLFNALRQRTTTFDAVLDGLQADHVRSAQMVGYLERALVHYQAVAPEGFARFREAVEAYALMLREHMEIEERLLAQAREALDEKAWQRIAAAFQSNDDPLFGAHGRAEFRKLYARIVNLLPRKMRLHLQQDTSAQ